VHGNGDGVLAVVWNISLYSETHDSLNFARYAGVTATLLFMLHSVSGLAYPIPQQKLLESAL
jgi:hypothetical protein